MTKEPVVRAALLALALALVDLLGARLLDWLGAGQRMFAGGVAGALTAAVVFGFLALRLALTFVMPGYVVAVIVRAWLERRYPPRARAP